MAKKMIEYITDKLKKASYISVHKYTTEGGEPLANDAVFVQLHDEHDEQFCSIALCRDDAGYYTTIASVDSYVFSDKPISLYAVTKLCFNQITDVLLDVLKQNNYLP